MKRKRGLKPVQWVMILLLGMAVVAVWGIGVWVVLSGGQVLELISKGGAPTPAGQSAAPVLPSPTGASHTPLAQATPTLVGGEKSFTPTPLVSSPTLPTVTVAAAPTATPVPTPLTGPLAEMVEHELKSEGMAFSLPKRWLGLELNPQQTQALIDRAKIEYPEARAMLEAFGSQAAANTALKFVGLETDKTVSASGFSPNVAVVRVTVPAGTGFEAFAQVNLQELERLPNRVGGSSYERLTIAGLSAGRITSTFRYARSDGQSFDAAALQYILLSGVSGYVLSYSALPSQMPMYRAVFEKSANSFRLLR